MRGQRQKNRLVVETSLEETSSLFFKRCGRSSSLDGPLNLPMNSASESLFRSVSQLCAALFKAAADMHDTGRPGVQDL